MTELLKEVMSGLVPHFCCRSDFSQVLSDEDAGLVPRICGALREGCKSLWWNWVWIFDCGGGCESLDFSFGLIRELEKCCKNELQKVPCAAEVIFYYPSIKTRPGFELVSERE
ncbi:MAG: hypothetical protein ACK50P_22960 [Planctomycetaceae bacterium]